MNTNEENAGVEDHPVGDQARRQRFILSSTVLTIPGTWALVGVPFALGWPAVEVAAEPGARLAFTLLWCFVAFLPYAAVCAVIAQVRLLGEAHNPLAGAEDESLKIHCRVMQNTLEQLVWFILCILPLAVLLGPDQMHLVPLCAWAFVLARLAYWRGYFLNGTLGRKYGVQMTFTLNGTLLVLVPLLWSGVL
jgi:uncharacterized MAPEG superfamily protein